MTWICLLGLGVAACNEGASSAVPESSGSGESVDELETSSSSAVEETTGTQSDTTSTTTSSAANVATTAVHDGALTSNDVNDDLCASADAVYVAFGALSSIEPGDDEALNAILTEAVGRANTFDGLSEGITDVGRRVAEPTSVVFDIFAATDFRADRLTNGDLDQVAEASDELDLALVELRDLIDRPCFRTVGDFDELDEAASLLGRQSATEVSDTLPDVPVDPSTGAIEAVRIEDSAGRISVEVPVSWTDINPLGGQRLTAGPEDSAFVFNFGIRGTGMFIFSGPATDAAADAELRRQATVNEMIDRGCDIASESDFDNSRYQGQEFELLCVGSPIRSHVIVGTTADQTISFIVGIARRNSEPGVRDLIANTFIID